MTLQICEFKLSGQPTGKGRPRFTKSGHTYTPTKTKEYEQRIKRAAWAEMQRQGLNPTGRRVNVIVGCYFEIPKSYSKMKRLECQSGILIPKKPDVDNVIKAVLDACNEIVYDDDAQVWYLAGFKRYCDEGQEPHIHVKIQWDDPTNIPNLVHTNPAND